MPRPTRVQAIYIALSGLLIVAVAFYFITRDAQDTAETRTQQRDAAVGAAKGVIDCVIDPNTQNTDECEEEAQQAQETLQEEVPPATLTGKQRREVVLIASRLIATQPDLTEDDIVDEVLDRLPDPEQGDRGRRGPTGADGETPSSEEVRALVELVYAANPPAPGTDGTDGIQGGKGDAGQRGSEGPTGPPGPQGPAGPPGADGANGTDGANGAEGAAGQTGPTGPQGPAGPACPSGYTGMDLNVVTDGGHGQLVVPIFACVPDAPAE